MGNFENFDATKYINAFFELINSLIAAFAKPEEGEEEKNIIASIKAAVDTFLGTIKE